MSVAEIESHQLELDASSGGGLWSEAVYRLSRNPSAIIGAFLVLMFVVAAVFAPVIAPYHPLDQNLSLLEAGGIPPGPSIHHILGVDLLGRDVFTRILYGARYSLLIGIVSVTIGLSIGLLLGSIAGYVGGYADTVIMRAMDIMLAIPGLLFAIGIVAMLGPGLKQIMIAIGVVNIPIFARFARFSSRTSSRTRCRSSSCRRRSRWQRRSSTSPDSGSSVWGRRTRRRRSGGRCSPT